MAAAMEGITTKSAGEFNQAQTVLLGFTNIVGEQLPQALKQAANFSVRTGADMKSAAETVGRALDIPSVGMASLARQGFKFSESQIEAAEKLEQTGRIAEAQQIVLNALEGNLWRRGRGCSRYLWWRYRWFAKCPQRTHDWRGW